MTGNVSAVSVLNDSLVLITKSITSTGSTLLNITAHYSRLETDNTLLTITNHPKQQVNDSTVLMNAVSCSSSSLRQSLPRVRWE